MRILGLDVGKKRIGVAVSDELGWTAQGLHSLERHGSIRDFAELKKIVDKQEISEIVVGLPINMDGSLGKEAKEVIGFVDLLRERLSLPIKTWDERLTSVQAERVLLEADITRRRRRRVIDKLAAQIILQSYLDSKCTKRRS